MSFLNRYVSKRSFDTRTTLQSTLVLVVLFVFASFISKGVFLKLQNLINLVLQNTSLLIISLGQFLVIATGGIDLSVGGVMAVSSVLTVMFMDYGLVPAFLAALTGALIFGLINGFFVTFVRLPAFVVTLATMQISYSVSKLLSDAAGSRGGTVYTGLAGTAIPTSFTAFFTSKAWGIPYPLMICVLFAVGIALYLKTSNGHFTFPVGGNERSAFLSGIPVWQVKMTVYAISALMAGIAGIVFASRLGLGDPQAGTWISLDSIAAVSIGGASLAGGIGTVPGTLIGVIILGVLSNIMNLIGVPVTFQPAVRGLIILIAVYFNSAKKQ